MIFKRKDFGLDARVRRAIDHIVPPCEKGLVSSARVKEIAIEAGHVSFAIEIAPAEAAAFEPIRRHAIETVKSVSGVTEVTAVLTAHRKRSEPAREAPHRHTHGAAPQPARPTRAAPGTLFGIEHVKAIIAVASGKGGVGKSTVAINLAVALSLRGLKVGLLDADIYGPSVPRLAGLAEKPEADPETKRLIPLERHGLKLMSIGFIVQEETAMIWRGPMVQSALLQMLRDVEWGELDILVIDMPPGTGDAHLTLAQQVPLKGAVIVSTPQDIALIDARKAISMFEKVHVPILGVVENMSYFLCPKCGERSEIFSHGGARAEAAGRGVPFLGEVPLSAIIRERSDAGEPVAALEGETSAPYHQVAEAVVNGLATATRPAPRLVIEGG